MCAINNPDELAKLKRKEKQVVGWKIVRRNGSPLILPRRSPYGPGVSRAIGATNKYNEHRPRGVHVYRKKKDVALSSNKYSYEVCVVKVIVKPKDIIAAEELSMYKSQLVAKEVEITLKDWENAGLPKRTVRKRYI